MEEYLTKLRRRQQELSLSNKNSECKVESSDLDIVNKLIHCPKSFFCWTDFEKRIEVLPLFGRRFI
jgi:hypothetical protein